MKATITVTVNTTTPLYGLFIYIEEILLAQSVPNIKLTLEGMRKVVESKYPQATTKQVQQGLIYLGSRKDRDYYDIYRVSKGTYRYVNYNLKYKTICID